MQNSNGLPWKKWVAVEVAAAVTEKGERGEGGIEGDGRMRERGWLRCRRRSNEEEVLSASGQRR
ncbi:hypothetical protein TIFTF001_031372 [Ficus carica]|uniref:Uncharacterized protein n=1 Tax=Ficus carica TaxID=3494 RepID=A0AA88J5E0_FICCA|nr:hypothetical protein TIFTF001_031372 [Ficus carica]